MYKVLEYFTDTQDKGYAYRVDDIYPREGYAPTAERIDALVSDKNVRKHPVIQEFVEVAETVAVQKTDVPEKVEITEEKPKKRKKRSDKTE